MTSITLELPEDITINEGEEFSLRGVAHDGKFVVREVGVKPAPKKAGERAKGVQDFLAFVASLPRGPLSYATDEELDEIRYQHLKEKHLR